MIEESTTRQMLVRSGARRGAAPRSGSIGWEARLLQVLVAAAAGAAYGRAAEAGFGDPALQGLVALLAAAGVVVVLGQEHLREALNRGVGTPERKGYGVRALLLTVAPPFAIALTLVYLAGYEHRWLFDDPEAHSLHRGVVFGVLVAVLVWLLIAAASAPLLAIGARRRSRASSASWPPAPGDLAGLPWPDTFQVPKGDPYKNDAFNRADDVRRFCDLLMKGRAPAVWALSGPWGSGKSAFARMAAAECERRDGASTCIEVSAPAGRLGGSPLFDLAAALAHGLCSTNAEGRGGGMSRVFDLARCYGEPVRLAQELRAGDDPRGTLNEFAGAVRELVDESSGRVVLWIDDLDRCPPDYALEMLHTVRAVAACRKLSTVLVLNHDALVAAAGHRFGLGSAAEAYLNRFIDFKIDLPPLSGDDVLPGGLRERWMLDRAEAIGLAETLNDAAPLRVLAGAAWTETLSLRDLEQIVYRASVVLGGIPNRLPALPGEMGGPEPSPAADRATISLAVCAQVLFNVWDPTPRRQILALVDRDRPPREAEVNNIIGSAPFIPCIGGGPSYLAHLRQAITALRACHNDHHTGRVPHLSIIKDWASQITPPRSDP